MQNLNRTTAKISQKRPVKVLQFGEGNFMRAFVDWIIHTMNQKTDFNGDIQMVQPIDAGLGQLINGQEGLYHVVLNGILHNKMVNETTLIDCVRGVINPYSDYQAFLDQGKNADLEFIFSNTTEAGIAFDENDTDFSKTPHTFPGKLCALLHTRFEYFQGNPPTHLHIIPCELIEKNGETLKEMLIQYAKLWNLSGAFTEWLSSGITFSNTLVDRIVPGFPKENITEIQETIGFSDQLVVTAEPFHLWVIEPHYAGKDSPELFSKRFPAQAAGLEVKVVEDLVPYRTRKVRILNGAHTVLVPVAYLKGWRTVREAVEDAEMGEFLRKAIYEEIVPTLDLPQEELHSFAESVMERFKNPYIRHELISIALNSVSKFKVRVLPSLLGFVEKNQSLPASLTHALACLIAFYKGSWDTEVIPLNDTEEVLSFMKNAWSANSVQETVEMVLSNQHFWGQDLCKINGLVPLVVESINQIQEMKVA